ncbi:DUF4383 domain-containing protein [Modestobacter lapidis]|nr:DUF4383 domain-containing protein [Modestobacter lapidis]
MNLKSHLPHHTPRSAPAPSGAGPASDDAPTPGGAPTPGVYRVQRAGALVVALFLLLFGVLGLSGGLDFFSTEGEDVLGLSSNGLLSVLSLVTAALLIGADLRGPRVASTVMIVIGSLFLLSALGNLAALRTSFNVLAFEMSNVLFSVVVGLVLLVLGAYGRISGNLPPDSPYAHAGTGPAEPPESYPSTAEEFAAEAAMREAELAVLEHRATDEQRRRVQAMHAVHTRADRRRVWLQVDAQRTAPAGGPLPAAPPASVRDRIAGLARRRRHGARRVAGK